MTKAANDIWGNCPYKRITRLGRPRGWRYICGKTGNSCNPNYCLGPDESMKGEENEEED